MITKFLYKKCCIFQYVNKIVYSNNFEQYLPQKLLKNPTKFVNTFEVLFNLVTVTHFYYDQIFTTKMTNVTMLLTNLFISKDILYHLFLKFSFIYHLIFLISTISAKAYNGPTKVCY